MKLSELATLIFTPYTMISQDLFPKRISSLPALASLFAGRFQEISISLLVSTIILCQPAILSAQSYNRTITKSAEFADKSDANNKFGVENVNGSVTIEAYEGNTIELTVEEEIRGTSQEIERGKQELEYKLQKKGSLILAYLDAPFVSLKMKNNEIHYRIDRKRDDYQFTHNVHVKVPRGIMLQGSTINKGTLSISGIFKEIKARNVNGAIHLEQIVSKTNASTVNGDITASYEQAPDDDSEYNTVNGTIEVFMPGDLSADVYFSSMHGDLYTDFENIQRLNPQVKKSDNASHSGTTYQVDKFKPLRFGNGGPKLYFRVLNGDVYLQKQS